MRLEFPIRSDKLAMAVKATAHVASVASEFQQIDVYDTEAFGRVLLLDGHIQLAGLDERLYHEALVQVPLANLAAPRRALVVGGGDGGVLRELCRHGGLEAIEMVEIDAEVVRVCREHLPGLSGGAFDDPRVSLTIGDAFEFLRSAEGPYDLVVVDSTDIYEDESGELAEMLFTEEFYRDVARVLGPGGVAVSQADNPVFCPYTVEASLDLYSRVFPATGWYWAPVPSFGGYSAFVWGGGTEIGPAALLAGSALSDAQVAAGFVPLRLAQA